MVSRHPVIALRLDQATFDKIRELAARDGRSMSNYVEHRLKSLMTVDLMPALPDSYYDGPAAPEPVRKAAPKKGVQVDLITAIAQAVKAGPITTTAAKQAKHRVNLGARAARMAARAGKHK
jgi:hypothetical protein